MRKSHPLAYRVTAGDLRQVVEEHANEYQETCFFYVSLHPNLSYGYFCEAVVREGCFSSTGRELIRVRGPLDGKDSGLWPQQMLRLLLDAYSGIEGEPWLWGDYRRRQATGQ